VCSDQKSAIDMYVCEKKKQKRELNTKRLAQLSEIVAIKRPVNIITFAECALENDHESVPVMN